eukprot:TRINITY_DN15187_c0_g1_i1.p1 TRINITY_DN15187_c0_g1~~TRINITY_DN15187_c0_g1_i1.p1  ORF type:complete len:467 (+),score=111.16 TRINITY_DN15187_c0_g1_i1:70-1401(+)
MWGGPPAPATPPPMPGSTGRGRGQQPPPVVPPPAVPGGGRGAPAQPVPPPMPPAAPPPATATATPLAAPYNALVRRPDPDDYDEYEAMDTSAPASDPSPQAAYDAAAAAAGAYAPQHSDPQQYPQPPSAQPAPYSEPAPYAAPPAAAPCAPTPPAAPPQAPPPSPAQYAAPPSAAPFAQPQYGSDGCVEIWVCQETDEDDTGAWPFRVKSTGFVGDLLTELCAGDAVFDWPRSNVRPSSLALLSAAGMAEDRPLPSRTPVLSLDPQEVLRVRVRDPVIWEVPEPAQPPHQPPLQPRPPGHAPPPQPQAAPAAPLWRNTGMPPPKPPPQPRPGQPAGGPPKVPPSLLQAALRACRDASGGVETLSDEHVAVLSQAQSALAAADAWSIVGAKKEDGDLQGAKLRATRVMAKLHPDRCKDDDDRELQKKRFELVNWARTALSAVSK